MTKVSYAKLGLKVNNEVNTFTFKDQEIEVLKYLPIEDKYDLLMITLQKAEEDGLYNELLLDTYFHLHLVYMYTNLSFTEKQREDELKLYNCLVSNGFYDSFLQALPNTEYEMLFEFLRVMKQEKTIQAQTTSVIIKKLIESLPFTMEQTVEVLNNLNENNFSQIQNLLQVANLTNMNNG